MTYWFRAKMLTSWQLPNDEGGTERRKKEKHHSNNIRMGLKAFVIHIAVSDARCSLVHLTGISYDSLITKVTLLPSPVEYLEIQLIRVWPINNLSFFCFHRWRSFIYILQYHENRGNNDYIEVTKECWPSSEIHRVGSEPIEFRFGYQSLVLYIFSTRISSMGILGHA